MDGEKTAARVHELEKVPEDKWLSIEDDKIKVLSRKNPYIVSIGYIVTTQQSLEYIPSRKVQPLAKEPIEIDNALIVTEDVAIIPAVETESCVLGGNSQHRRILSENK